MRTHPGIRNRLLTGFFLLVLVGGLWYLRHIGFPPSDGTEQLRELAGFSYEAEDVRYYRSRNFMDTWHLFRAKIEVDDMARFVKSSQLEDRGQVEYFDLIVSRPPPYWWHPERLPTATLYEGFDSSERSISVMHEDRTGTAYFLVY